MIVTQHVQVIYLIQSITYVINVHQTAKYAIHQIACNVIMDFMLTNYTALHYVLQI